MFLSDVETDVWPNGTVDGLAQRSERFVVTRGSEGADEHLPSGKDRHSIFPVEEVVDTNGAGDSFATAWMLAVATGHTNPAAVANWAGAMAVSKPQACKPACVADAIRSSWQTLPPPVPRSPAALLAAAGGLVWAPVQRVLQALRSLAA